MEPKMKPWIAVGALLLGSYGLSTLAPHLPAPVWESEASVGLAGALMFLAPIAGLFMLVVRFSRWQRGFHRRMRDGGLW